MAHTTAATAPVQKVVVVDGSNEVLGVLESVLDAGRYDMVFVAREDRAYSQIRTVMPDLVILCTRIGHMDGLQVLTMLKLDSETRDIPVLTYTIEPEGQDDSAVLSPLTDDEARSLRSVATFRMN